MISFASIKRLFSSQFLKKAGRDTFYFSLAQVASKLISIIALPILARQLSPSDFAAYDIFVIVANFFVLLITMGTDSGLVVSILDKAKNVENEKFFSIAVYTAVCGWAFLIAISAFIHPFFKDYISFRYALLSITYGMLIGVQGLFAAFLRWTDHSKKGAIVTFVGNISGMLVGLILALLNPKHFLSFFVFGLVSGAFFSVLLGLLFTSRYFRHVRIKQDWPTVYAFWSYSIPYLPGSLVNNILSNLDRIIIYPMFSSSVYATYAFCSRIAQLPRMGLSIIGTGIQPSLLKEYDTPQGSNRIKRAYEYFVVSFLLIVTCVILFNKQLISIFGGQQYASAHDYLPALVATSLLSSSIYFNGWGFVIAKKSREIGMLLLFFSVINFILSYCLSSFFGLLIMIYGSLFVNLLLSVTYTYRSERLYKFNYNFKLILLSFILLALLPILLQNVL